MSERLTWWEKSASMMITKLPVQKLRPWTYAVPRPSLPARGFRTCLLAGTCEKEQLK